MRKYKKAKISTRRGSILAYSLIILASMFAIVGSMSITSVLQKSGAGSSQSSAQAFQVADSGAQFGMKKINKALKDYPNDKINNAFGSCSNGIVSEVANVGVVIPYDLNFYNEDGTLINNCSEQVNKIKSIKSVASHKNTVRAVMVSVGDPTTKLLLHADGAGNTFVDSSVTNKTILAVGNVTQANDSPFGTGKSAYFDGVGDYLELDSSPDWDFGANDFTIDFWEKNSAINSRQHALSFGIGGASNNIDFDFNDSDPCDGSPKGLWVYWNGGGGNKICTGALNQYTDGQWYHIALVRKSGVMTLYVNGNSMGSTNYVDQINLAGAGLYHIGSEKTGTHYWNGYLDEIRISKGIARWTGNFTKPTSPY